MNLSSTGGVSNPSDDDGDAEDRNLDAKIVRALENCFSPPPLQASALADLQKRLEERSQLSSTKEGSVRASQQQSQLRKQAMAIALVSLAASLLVFFSWSRLLPRRDVQLVFHRQPLAVVYHDLVARGFQPYYVCDDQKRFQETMLHRHGQSLELNDRGNSLMLGLSYPGGWTADTTAILFHYQGSPVVIFVDSQPFPNDEPETMGNLTIRRKEIRGSFLVEISPLSESLLDTISAPTSGK